MQKKTLDSTVLLVLPMMEWPQHFLRHATDPPDEASLCELVTFSGGTQYEKQDNLAALNEALHAMEMEALGYSRRPREPLLQVWALFVVLPRRSGTCRQSRPSKLAP